MRQVPGCTFRCSLSGVCRIEVSGFRVLGLGVRVKGLRFRMLGLGRKRSGCRV